MESLNQYSFSIDQAPVAQQRPRFSKWGTYSPQGKEKKSYKREIDEKWLYLPCVEGLKLKVVFVLQVPKSYSKRKVKEIQEGKAHHIIKPDTSNFLKWIEDCMTGSIYRDDSQIYHLEAEKKYGEQARTEVFIETQEKLTLKKES